jgi:5,5'-dehydrodivanillate O-demethylase
MEAANQIATKLYTDNDFRDFAHIGPGTLAGRYMRTFWHPVYASEDLPRGVAKPIRILGEDLTLYRGEEGKPHVVGFRCAHRGTQLSVGWVEGDCIRCFYHGWKFDGSGQCVEQPAEPKPSPENVRISSYAVQDYLGLVFLYLGEGNAPPIERYPDYEEVEELLAVRTPDFRDYNFFQDFENGMDRAHTGFAHRSRPNSFDGVTDSPAIRAEEDEWGLKTYAEHRSGRLGIQSFGMPNKQHLVNTFFDSDGITWKVPIDDEHVFHIGFSAYRGSDARRKYEEERARRARKPQLDPMVLAKEIVSGRLRLEDVDPDTTVMVSLEDNIVLLGQGTIVDRAQEHLGRSDVPIFLLRKIWERELRALAEGRPLKKWTYTPGITHLRRT